MNNINNKQEKPVKLLDNIEQEKDLADKHLPVKQSLFTINKFIDKVASNEKANLYSKKVVDKVDLAVDFILKPKGREDRNEVVQAARPPIVFGMWVIFFTLGIGGMWAAFAPLDKASHASGIVVFETNKKLIQHFEGGIVEQIYVKDGDKVEEGQALIKLNQAQAQASFNIVSHQLYTVKATEARLMAERDQLPEIIFSPSLLEQQDINQVVREVIQLQVELFNVNLEKIKNLTEAETKRLESLNRQLETNDHQLKIAKQKLESFRKLFNNNNTTLTALQAAEQTVGELETRHADIEGKIAETNIRLLNIKSDNLSNIERELKDTRINIGDLEEKYLAAKDILDRVIIKSPVKGVVSELKVHTIGGVIGREPIMAIAPYGDNLIVEAKVMADNIDVISLGMKSYIRFTAFKARRVPGIEGEVIHISADKVDERMGEQMGGMPYYIVKIKINNSKEFENKYDVEIYPGMMADVSIVNGERTLLQYLLDPVLDTMRFSLKEK